LRVAIIHCNDGSDVRIGKICRSLSRTGYDTHFIGWDRWPRARKKIDLGGAERHVMVWETSHGKGTLAGQFAFFAHSVRTLRRLKPDVVSCVNEDCAFMLVPFRGVMFRHLVCDVFDALVDRHSAKVWPAQLALRVVSEVARSRSDRLIATDETRRQRFGRHAGKVAVVENVPEDPGDALAFTLPTGPTKIYAAGCLTESRGLRQLIQAVEPLDGVEILSAGWPHDKYSSDVFLKHTKVSFRGILTAKESLALAAQCDAVFCYYAPTSINNLFASPNKVYDAMNVGRPVLINREVHLASWVVAQALGWACAYADVPALREHLRRLNERRSHLPLFAAKARTLCRQGYTWEVMENRLDTLLRGLAEEYDRRFLLHS
jgi:hypothetical protein